MVRDDKPPKKYVIHSYSITAVLVSDPRSDPTLLHQRPKQRSSVGFAAFFIFNPLAQSESDNPTLVKSDTGAIRHLVSNPTLDQTLGTCFFFSR